MRNVILNKHVKSPVFHRFHKTFINAANVAGLCALSLFVVTSPAIGATLYTAGTTASVSNQFVAPFLRETDSGLSSSFASITLANGEHGTAQAFYNGDVKVMADSEFLPGTPPSQTVADKENLNGLGS